MEQTTFKFQTRSTHPDLQLQVQLNGVTVLQPELIRDFVEYEFLFDDADEGRHVVEFVVSGKTSEHTRIDADGNIVADETVEIVNVTVDDIEINQLFTEKAVYCHDFNGTQDTVDDQFYGTAGCNGVIRLEFTTPFYIWLLENM